MVKLLDIKGCLVSIDAMGCQTKIADDIVENGGDYLLAVKNNQPSLSKTVEKALLDTVNKKLKSGQLNIEQGHGRIEARQYCVLDAKDVAKAHPEWRNLKSIGVAIGYRQVKGSKPSLDYRQVKGSKPSLDYRQVKGSKPSLDYRYYISSAELTETRFSSAVRGHWAIENSLHWVLDATMNEDACQVYRDNSAENLACLRHMALNMLRSESNKLSIRLKQKRAWMKTSFLEGVLVTGFNNLDKI
ncbi:ISAs1 family transposase [Moritella yayanosii]|uniref:Transposase n=1 Tax=Moritella yayanosii TaxID=69539 RepID=A0A330LV02_9GAMM